jgi:hypothetical protein
MRHSAVSQACRLTLARQTSFDVIDNERGPLLPFSRRVAQCLLVSDLLDRRKKFARENLSSPLCKKNLLRQRPKSDLKILPSCPERGALAIVTNVGTGCGGRGRV